MKPPNPDLRTYPFPFGIMAPNRIMGPVSLSIKKYKMKKIKINALIWLKIEIKINILLFILGKLMVYVFITISELS